MNATDALFHQPAAQAVGWALLHFVWQGAVVAALTGAVLMALRRSAADVRYVVATIGMALMLTLPIVTGVQKWQSFRTTGPVVEETRAADAHAAAVAATPARHQSREAAAVVPTPATASLLGRARVGGAPRVEPILPTLLFVWLSGVTVLSLRLLTGWWWVQRLRTHGVTPAGDSWQSMAVRLARRLHLSRSIAILESTRVDVPTVVGWIKPVVLVPASALAGLSPEQLEAILAHELAHIRRHDYLVNLLQTLVETLLFYHPAVWWLSGRIRAERENCCDDLAVSLCGDPVAYAGALADLEALRQGAPFALAANGGSLLLRVRRLLGVPASHAGRGPAWLAGTAAALLVAGLALGADGMAQAPTAAEPQPAPVVTPTAPAIRPKAQADPATPHAPTAPRKPEVSDPDALKAVLLASELAEPATAAPAYADLQALEPVLASTETAVAAMTGAQAQLEVARANMAAHLAAQQDITAAQTTSMNESAVRSSVAAAAVAPILAAADSGMATAVIAASQVAESTSSHQHESSGNWVWSNNGEKLSVSYSGTFELTDDDTDIREISAGGYLKISDQALIGRHTVEIRERNGGVERRYFVNGSERPFEPDGRQWLHDNLPKFVRNTGIGADRRVARYLKSGGPSAVLAEISKVDGSYVKRIYFSELFKQATLSAEQYRQAMAQASREMKSDYELASLLISIADRLPNDDQSRAAYFSAAVGIQSDYELRRVYSTMLKRGPVSSGVLAGILEHSSTLQSDYELSELLRQVMAQQPLDDRTRAPFFQAVSTIQSDYERHRILTSVIGRSATDPATLAEAIKHAGSMSSDYEKASFLVDILKDNSIEGPARAPFFAVANSVNSSYERGRVLQTVLRKSDVSDDTMLAVLKSCGQMSSGYDRSQVLLLAASSHTLSGPLRDAYIDAADRLSSYEQGQVMTALVKSERRK
jgi:beta-lactamase regulating signal transducer with metallopeptidase domain